MNTSCPFCDRIKGGEFDYYNYYNVAFQPLNPVTPGHFLVVPRTHIVSAVTGPSYAGRALTFAAKLAQDMGLEAANFITSAGSAATQTVMHLHVHIVPRREGDGLHLPWTGQHKPGDGNNPTRPAVNPRPAGPAVSTVPPGAAAQPGAPSFPRGGAPGASSAPAGLAQGAGEAQASGRQAWKDAIAAHNSARRNRRGTRPGPQITGVRAALRPRGDSR